MTKGARISATTALTHLPWNTPTSGKCRLENDGHLSRSQCVKQAHFKIKSKHCSTGPLCMMTSSNGNIFRVTGPLYGEFTGPGEFPTQRPVTRSFDIYFDLRLNKRLSKQSWGWWFETLSRSLWRHRNGEISASPDGRWLPLIKSK